jgi:hypothetical protein
MVAFKMGSTPHDLARRRDFAICLLRVSFETWAKSLAWGLKYAVAGQDSAIDISPCRIIRTGREIRWSVGHWRPGAQLHELFQNIGREQHGDILRESFEEKGFGSNVLPRAVFEDGSERCMYGQEW